MSVFQPQAVRCACGKSFIAPLASGVNVQRRPKARREIIEGTFHRFTCPHCKRDVTVERDLTYVDFERDTFIKVRPRGQRHLWRETSAKLDSDMKRVPSLLSAPKNRKLRVVFGLGELREKLVAQDAGYDDRLVELFKVLLVYEHPFLLRRARLRIEMETVSSDLEFIAGFEHDARVYRIKLPKLVAEDLQERRHEVEQWLAERHTKSNVFALSKGDHWVNMWRWSPQPWALNSLKDFAAQVRKKKKISLGSSEFRTMLEQLPRGSHLPGWAKKDLRDVFVYVRKNGTQKLQDQLFEVRFGIELEDDWAKNKDPDDIDTLWTLLMDLPDSNVEGNTAIDEVDLDAGEGGGWYGANEIHIGAAELKKKEGFEDVVRHEVGHGVHERFAAKIDPWLQQRFGWERFGTSSGEIDGWVKLMGGWGNLTAAQKKEVRGFLVQALGPGEAWVPGAAPSPPQDHPWWSPKFGPRLALENSLADWFDSNDVWYRAKGKAFFLNYWYREFMAVDEATLKLIAKMPSNYAAMSPFEFFAELYALYYDLDDPKRKNVPANVSKWIKDSIGAPENGAG